MLIHDFATDGDLAGVKRELTSGAAVDGRDERDTTPLALAASSQTAGVDMLRLLIEAGADVNAKVVQGRHFPIECAACSGRIDKVQVLLDAGADINAVRAGNYTALLSVMYALSRREALVPMVEFLVKKGAVIDGQSDYGESPLSVASQQGRFDAVKCLLDAGADPAPLKWTPLMRAVALGSADDVSRCLHEETALDARDRFSRTPLHLAALLGDVRKAGLLHGRGAKLDDGGRNGTTPLMTSVDSGHFDMARWLIEQGADIEAADKLGHTALMLAAQSGGVECVRVLLEAGAQPNRRIKHSTAKSLTNDETIIRLLTGPGEDFSEVNKGLRRKLTGLTESGRAPLNVSASEFESGRERQFGHSNPQIMQFPFWHEMVRAGVCAYQARKQFGRPDGSRPPVWCFDRYGMSFTELPDGRFVQIAGEHEDFYDPDFCIYNDVVIHERSGEFQIMGYPENLFPPTDFHSATFVEGSIYIIGSLGYQGSRRFGTTPVYRLDCRNWKIQAVDTSGDNPGWIYKHRAKFDGLRSVVIAEGKIAQNVGGKEQHVENKAEYHLDLKALRWTRIETPLVEAAL